MDPSPRADRYGKITELVQRLRNRRESRGGTMRPPPPWSIAVGIGYRKGKQKIESTALMHWKNQPIRPLEVTVGPTGTVYELIRNWTSYWKNLRSGSAIWREDAYTGAKREQHGAHRSMSCNLYYTCVYYVLPCTDYFSSRPIEVG